LRSRGFVGAAAVAVVAAASLFGIYSLTSASKVSRDGDGVLASANDPSAHEAMSVDPTAWGGPWTFGLRLCLAHGSEPAVIMAVNPAATTGDGFHVLGAVVRDWDATAADPPVISVDEFPLTTHAELHPAVGFGVTEPCSDPASIPGRFTELDIGFGRVGADGGGWKGVNIDYTVSGRAFTVHLDHDLLICGPSVQDACNPPASSAAPT
jgi:hypothetical protein